MLRYRVWEETVDNEDVEYHLQIDHIEGEKTFFFATVVRMQLIKKRIFLIPMRFVAQKQIFIKRFHEWGILEKTKKEMMLAVRTDAAWYKKKE